MQDFMFITGNQHKVEYLAKWLGRPVHHQKVDLDELQSLDLAEVVTHKAKAAYEAVHKPVLVEDVSLQFHALGRLPGPLIKWFLEELQPEGLAKLVGQYDDKRATARILYGLYDGNRLYTFEGVQNGRVAPQAAADRANDWNAALTWNAIFIPDGCDKTYAELSDEALKPYSHRAKAIAKLAAFLDEL